MILLRKAHRSLTARTGRIGVSGQHGFIPDGSCAFAALVMDQIRAAAVRGDCDQACCLSADATRAFDKVTFDAVAAGITWCAGSPRDVALTMSFLIFCLLFVVAQREDNGLRIGIDPHL